jgi:hypothetical protein
LYWKERRTYDRLTATAEQLRAEHRRLLTGKSADIRAAEQTHREAVRAALDSVKRVLHEGGHAATEATLTAVQETLEALPSDDAPGRLVKPLKPRGFEALAGLPQASGPRGQAPGPRTQAPGSRPQAPGPRLKPQARQVLGPLLRPCLGGCGVGRRRDFIHGGRWCSTDERGHRSGRLRHARAAYAVPEREPSPSEDDGRVTRREVSESVSDPGRQTTAPRCLPGPSRDR